MPDLARNFLGFTLGTVEYAVHVSLVRGVVRPSPVSEVPRMPQGVLGVAYLRGEVVPVVDLRTLFGMTPRPADAPPAKWVLVSGNAAAKGDEALTAPFVLVVDSVSGVFGASASEEHQAPEMLTVHDVPKFLFVTKRADALVFALDVAAISAHLPDALPSPETSSPP